MYAFCYWPACLAQLHLRRLLCKRCLGNNQPAKTQQRYSIRCYRQAYIQHIKLPKQLEARNHQWHILLSII